MRSKLRNASLLSFDSVSVVLSFVIRIGYDVYCYVQFLMVAILSITKCSYLYSHIIIIIIYRTIFREWHGKTLLMAFLQLIFRFKFHWLKICFFFLLLFFLLFIFHIPLACNTKCEKKANVLVLWPLFALISILNTFTCSVVFAQFHAINVVKLNMIKTKKSVNLTLDFVIESAYSS